MGIKTLSTSLKKEELQVAGTNIFAEEENLVRESNHHVFDCSNLDNIDDDDAENLRLQEGLRDIYGQQNYWDCLMPPWDDGFVNNEEEAGDDGYENNYFENNSSSMFDNMQFSIKNEAEYAFLEEDDDKKLSLNLSLNYQEVLDAWSARTLWADESSIFVSANNSYMGEVPVIEEERRRREASVLRYKEKRLFSKKIR